MKKLILTLAIVLIFNINPAFAMEHSALSNIFTLDTRDTPWVAMQHSALSNIFTLDTRDAPTSASGLQHSALSNVFALDTRDAVIMASIDSYNPNIPIEVKSSNSVNLRVTFTHKGNAPWQFIVGATVWDSNGNIVGEYEKKLDTTLQPGDQTTVSWNHTVNKAGDYWLQFAVWKDKPYNAENLLDKKPSPAQKLIVSLPTVSKGEQPLLKAPWWGKAKISQGNHGSTSHHEYYIWENTYAIDVALNPGTEVLAPADGIINWYDDDPKGEGGIELAIDHTGSTGEIFTTVYLHLSQIMKKNGAVKQGEVVAKSGNTGNVTGAHLHFHIWSGDGSRDSHTIPIQRLIMKQVGVDNDFREYNALNGDLDDNKIAQKYFESNNGIKGDVDGDGIITSKDAMLSMRISTSIITPSEYQQWAADMNDDGQTRADDAIRILRKSAGLAAPDNKPGLACDKTISIMLEAAHGVAGESIIVPLKIDNIDVLAGGDVYIAYDSIVLRAVDVSSDADLFMEKNINEPGTVRIAFAATGKLNNQAVAKIRFDILTDDISPLTLKEVELYSSDALCIDSRKVDGRFSSWAIPPKRSALLQNFPNPFNPDTWMPYQLKEGSDVIIKIYSVAGELVREMELGYKPAGSYISQDRAAYWDGRNMAGEYAASGVYFCTIQAGGFTATGKMVVAK